MAIARFAQKYRGPGLSASGPDRHLRNDMSASPAPSVPRSLEVGEYVCVRNSPMRPSYVT